MNRMLIRDEAPKKNFVLSADEIMSAQDVLVQRLQQS